MTIEKETPSPASHFDARTPNPAGPPKTKPVVVLATLGALMFAFEAFVIVHWVTGPYFTRVEPGPSQPPTWMKVELILWQTLSIPAGLALIYWFIIRPWRREGRVGIDGILVAAFCSVMFQDPLSSYGGHWFAYNTWMFNRGSWVNSVPGWNSFGKPGAMLSEPVLFTWPAYVYIFVIAMIVGSVFMRRMRKRFPRIGNIPLIASCYGVMIVFDVILEGIIWMPLGIFHYAGGRGLALFPDHYFKWPVHEGLTIGLVFTAVACLRFFVNDRGQSVVERGIDDIQGGHGKKFVVRVLAMTFVVQGLMFVGYNVPNYWIGTHSATWPKDVQERSYFLSGLCGEGTDGRAQDLESPSTSPARAMSTPTDDTYPVTSRSRRSSRSSRESEGTRGERQSPTCTPGLKCRVGWLLVAGRGHDQARHCRDGGAAKSTKLAREWRTSALGGGPSHSRWTSLKTEPARLTHSTAIDAIDSPFREPYIETSSLKKTPGCRRRGNQCQATPVSYRFPTRGKRCRIRSRRFPATAK